MALSSKQITAIFLGSVILILIYYTTQQLSTVENDLEQIKEIVAQENHADINAQESQPPVFVKEENEMLFQHIENNGKEPAGSASPKEEFDRIWEYVNHMQYQCKESEYLGGDPGFLGDGAYKLCTEDRFWPVKRNSEQKCLMYSIGVGPDGGDFSFDDEIAKRGCEVHSFDPTTVGVDGHTRKSGVTFHKIGINNEDIDKNHNGWKMRTLKTLMKELGHEGRHLDYLKIDTDAPQGGFEDTLMEELINTGMHSCVRQFAMEIHLLGPISQSDKLGRCRTLYKQMAALNDFGWRLYNTTDNVRYLQLKRNNMKLRNTDLRPNMLNGKGTILWENTFVNFEVKGPCIPKNNDE